jgi:hypothetical protein
MASYSYVYMCWNQGRGDKKLLLSPDLKQKRKNDEVGRRIEGRVVVISGGSEDNKEGGSDHIGCTDYVDNHHMYMSRPASRLISGTRKG